MKTSIVIPYFGRNNSDFKKITNCLISITRGNYKPDEIIIVDDASKLKLEIQSLPKQLRSITKIVSHKKNRGPGNARNSGVNASQGDLIIFLDSDVEVKKNTLKLILETSNTNDVVVGIYSTKALDKTVWGNYKALFYYFVHTQKGLNTIQYDQFNASCSAIKKKIFLKIGGYANWLGPGMDIENEEIGYRIVKKYKMVLNPKINVDHHFPSFKKMTSTFFYRSSLWFELFSIKRKFSKTAGTSSNGLFVLSAFLNIFFLNIYIILQQKLFLYISLTFLILHILGFRNFYLFLFKQKKILAFFLILIHFYSCNVISTGIMHGALKILIGRSYLRKKILINRN